MTVATEKPHCAECDRPLQRSTYFYNFLHKHPDEASSLTSVEDARRLIPEGHAPTNGRQSFHWVHDDESDFEGRIVGVNLWDGKSYGSRDGLCGRCAHAPKKSRKKIRQRRISLQIQFEGELPEDHVEDLLKEIPELFHELIPDGENHPVGRLLSVWLAVQDGQDPLAECQLICSPDGVEHDTTDIHVADRAHLLRLGYRLEDAPAKAEAGR